MLPASASTGTSGRKHLIERRSSLRFDADHLDSTSVPGSDPANEPSAAHGDKHGIQITLLLLEFQSQGSLAEQSFALVKRMDRQCAGLGSP